MSKGYEISYFPPCGADTIARLEVGLEIAHQRNVWAPVENGANPDGLVAASECSLDGVHHVVVLS